MPVKKSSPENQRSLVCEKCHGTGYIFDPDEPVARRCDCGILDAAETRVRLQSASIPPRYRTKDFTNFKPGSDSKLRAAVDYCRSYAQHFHGEDYDGFLLRGVPGSGKTHLAIATMKEVLLRGYTAQYANFGDLLARIRESYTDASGGSEYTLLSQVSGTDLLVLDDLGAESMTDWVRDRLYLIVNKRYELNRPIIVTTNCDEGELTNRIGLRIASRLKEMCLVGPDLPSTDFRIRQMR